MLHAHHFPAPAEIGQIIERNIRLKYLQPGFAAAINVRLHAVLRVGTPPHSLC